VKRAAAEGEALLRQAGARNVLVLDDDAQPAFWAELDDFAQTAKHGPHEALLRIAALPMECATVAETAQAMAREHGIALAWLADTLTGTVWLRLRGTESPGAASHEGADAASGAFGAALRAIQDALVHRWRNSVILDCPPALKPHIPIWGADPSALDLMREVKRSFDPDHRLNPGRFIAEA
ncbi:MAG: FAD-linked oxidase C-terminal domain-containing protein, partial [Ktedonobacterales bacterium]